MDSTGNIISCIMGGNPVIEICLQGPQSKRTIQAAEFMIADQAKTLGVEKIRLLVVLNHLGHFDYSALNETIFPTVVTQFEKVAFYGQTGFVKEATKLVARSAGMFYKNRIKLFEDRDTALKWLQLESSIEIAVST